jgi:hypothetical protein
LDQKRGFLRDVAQVAAEEGLVASDAAMEGLVASDATVSAISFDPWYGGTYVQLSDEEILANNKDLADFFEIIEVCN